MAYSGKIVSIKNVVESAYMDAGIDEINYPFAVETCVNLMGTIGVPDLYVEKNTNDVDAPALIVQDYKALLPTDMVSLKDVRKITLDGEGKILSYSEMIESSDIYHRTQDYSESTNISYFDPTADYPDLSLDEFDELNVGEGVIVGTPAYYQEDYPYTYKLQENYIFTNFKEGVLELVYLGYPLDNDGFPMIPDDEKFKNALKYEIIYKIDWKKWRLNPASPGLKALVNDSEQRRDWYVAAARNKARIPTIGQMEAIKNQWLRTMPRLNNHRDGFKTNNIMERRYNQSSKLNRKNF